jgi:hypothetical protein
LFKRVAQREQPLSDNSQRIFNLKEVYVETIDAVIAFLQNENPTLAHRIASRHYLPEAARFAQTDDLDWAFGTMGIHDKARHLATLYLEDISDLIVDTVDPHFGVSRYAEKIAMAASSFDLLNEALQKPPTFIDELILELFQKKIEEQNPTIMGFSVPFQRSLSICSTSATRKQPEAPTTKKVWDLGSFWFGNLLKNREVLSRLKAPPGKVSTSTLTSRWAKKIVQIIRFN